ncbi:hypothetical protein C8Q75DRAFT_727557 [Abortiporus biennis]|nr:hypothetical protein C8Q75DRAFT_727557 [Abortiporus biennis]
MISEQILDHCSPRDICRLYASCKPARAAIQSYFTRYRLNGLLSRFFTRPDCIEFRKMQARTSTLISGSFALQFFDRSFYLGSDLDIYVSMHTRREVGFWLLQHGYTFAPKPHQKSGFEEAVEDKNSLSGLFIPGFGPEKYRIMRGVAGVFDFVKSSPNDPEEELKIQMIVAEHSIMEIILEFHSTCVMNVISYNTAYCLFPIITLEDRLSIECPTSGPSQRKSIDKYWKRGFTMVDKAVSLTMHNYNVGDNAPFRVGPRYMGDGLSWTIPLETHELGDIKPFTPNSTALTDDPVAASNWIVAYDESIGGQMMFKTFHDKSLAFKYVASDPEGFEVINSKILKRLPSVAPPIKTPPEQRE